MRSLSNESSDGWPNDMEIHVSVNDDQLLELLYLRDRLSLPAGQSLPRFDPPVPSVDLAEGLAEHEVAQWAARWGELWEQAWSWTLEFRSAKRTVAASEVFTSVGPAPRWETLYGDDRFDRDAFEAWKRSVAPPLPTWPTPERAALEAVVSAWERGFDTCYVLPFAGSFAQQVGSNALMLSSANRNDPGEYSRALAAFSPS